MYKPVEDTSISMYEINRGRIVRSLELIQDLIVISLCIGLFSFMVLQVRDMFLSLLPPLDFHAVTADILFLLILVELFRLLIIYLQEQRISIGVLGLLLLMRVWLPPTFEGIDPEQEVSKRYKSRIKPEFMSNNRH